MKANTKIKIGQGIVLLGVLLIEIVGFHNDWKYSFLNRVNPILKANFIENILTIKFVSIVVLFLLITIYWRKLNKVDEEPLFIVYLIKGFQVKGSDLIGLLNVSFVLCSIAWIGMEFYLHTLQGYLNAIIYSGFMLLYPLIVANYFLPKPISKHKYHPKILITAVSNLVENNLQQSLDEMNSSFPDKWRDQVYYNIDNSLKTTGPFQVPWGPWGIFDPVRKSIIEHHAQFHEIILIVSREVAKNIEQFQNDELKPKYLVENFLKRNYPNHKTVVKIVSDGISGNDMKMNITGIENILHTLSAQKILDKDILFNITGGTAAISGAMILNAIPSDRRAEYARQDTGMIEEIPLDIYDVKDLWKELLEKVG